MFCPNCRAEYKEGISDCPDCHVGLVPELPAQPEPEYIEYEEILSTFNPFDIAMIKSLLEGADIIYYFHGEQFSYVRPWVEPARLMVCREQADEAREFLKDLKLTFMAGGSGEKEDNEE